MTRNVVITGIGLISPAGCTSSELHRALNAADKATEPDSSGIEEPSTEADAGPVPLRTSLLASFEPRDYLPEGNLRPLDRPSQFVTSAAALALDDAGLEASEDGVRRMGIVAGTMFSGAATISEFDIRGRQEGPARVSALDFANTVINAAAGQAALWHRMTGLNSTISTGGTSGLQAIGYAAEMIRNGREDVILAGGFESVSPAILSAISRSPLFEASNTPSSFKLSCASTGLHVSEGAAFLVLENEQTAIDRGAAIKARVSGFASRFCSGLAHLSGQSVSDGESSDAASHIDRFTNTVAATMQDAMADAGLTANDIGLISLSVRDSGMIDMVEANAIRAVFDKVSSASSGSQPDISAIVPVIGDALGAMGAFQAVDAVETLASGTISAATWLRNDQHSTEATTTDPTTAKPALTSKETGSGISAVLICSTSCDGYCSTLALVPA